MRAGLRPSGAEDKSDCSFIPVSHTFSWYAQGQRYHAFTNGWFCESCVDGVEDSFECKVQCIYNSK
jgi:hypothetical protein